MHQVSHYHPLLVLLHWLLAFLTIDAHFFGAAANIQSGAQEHLFGQSRGVSLVVTSVYVPLLIVTTVVPGWQLCSRCREGLTATATTRARNASAVQPSARG